MPFTHGHALIIGVGSYQYEPRLNVPITVADAEAVATVVRDPQFCGYPAAQVTLLTNATATRDRILAALNDLAARTTHADTVLIFYSGHGAYSADKMYHLTTHDTRWAGDQVAAGTAVSQPELLDRLRAIPAQRLLLLINACHAGELSPVLGGSEQLSIGQPLPAHTADAILATGSGRIIITACREQQVSYIGPGPLTIFAQALTDGLRGHGFSGRAGYISVFDLYTHLYFAVTDAVQRHVTPAQRQLHRCDTQEPELTVLKGVGPFPVALYRGATTLGDFPADHAPPAGVALREVPPEHSQWVFAQSISGAGAVGIGGSASNSPIITGTHNTVIQSGRDTIRAGRDVNQIGGDYVAGDKITTGNISGTGIAIGSHAQAIVQQSSDHAAFARAFAAIYAAIKARPEDPNVDKTEMSDTVKKIEQEALKRDQANEHKLTRWLRNLAAMADDIFEVTVAALTGPQAAFATVARKVAEKVRKEQNDE
ncbi:peptidase C14 [Chloroflexus islandicus]|uniref:Peptidase C14 n=1 Tax=Chloroflexus islandicus TaxID=1707952 RepID=A0A178M8R3_9CHLR|nr:caspase family protein [Chloroflexus islandicus]OAN45149.1 peptidase C14 [Chloroflexus islandicus]